MGDNIPKSSDLAPSTMSALEVLARLTQIARGDIGDFIDDSGCITLAGRDTQLVKRFKKRGNTTTIELYSALDALGLLAQYHELITRYQHRRVNTATVNPISAERNYN